MTLPFECMFFFFTAPATPRIYTLSLHDALPIFARARARGAEHLRRGARAAGAARARRAGDRKSTRLNSSHVEISYAVFCLKKKNHLTQALAAKLGYEHVAITCIQVCFHVIGIVF